MTNTVRAIVGARVSVFEDGKESQITQRTKGTAYAESQGWEVIGAFEDLGESAIKRSPWERPDLAPWLGDRSGEWDALIFAKTDRVFRSAADCVRLAEWCRDNQKILVLVDDGIRLDYFHPDAEQDAFAGAMSKVFLILASVFAEIEGQRFVQRARDRVTQYRSQPRWAYGVPPYGFEVIDRAEGGKALGHDAEAQQVIHDIANRLINGGSLTRITSDLNENGTPSPADRLRQRTGKPLRGSRWTTITVLTILSNPATQGVKTAKGKPVLDANGEPVRVGPATFDPEKWAQIQAALAQRSQSGKTRRHSINPLLGVAKCGDCGNNMRNFQRTGPTGIKYRYYICGSTPKACPGVLVNADDADQTVETAFLHVHNERRITKRVWLDGSDHSMELEQTTKTIELLREDRALGLFTTEEDQALFRSQMIALVKKRDELAKLPVVRSGWINVETEKTYGSVWPTASLEERRKLLNDAGMTLTVRSRTDYGTYIDLDKALGEGPVGQELYDEIEARAAAERERHGLPADLVER